MTNQDIRRTMKEHRIKFWQLADQLGMGEASMTRWFRHELDGERLERVRKAIDELVKAGSQKR